MSFQQKKEKNTKKVFYFRDMKNIYYTLLFALCSLSSFAQQTNETTTINGVQREYIQYLPINFDVNTEHLPTVIILHGLGGTNAQMAVGGFNQIADTARCIALYPQGLPNAFSQNAWNNGTAASSTADDLAFINYLMDKTINDLNSNPAKQYITGFSMGSIMSYHLACNLNDRVAAIGAMAGPMSTSDLNSCSPSYSTPIIHFHGTDDATVPYNANPLPTLSLVTETLDFWKNQKTCGTTQDSIRINDSANDGLTTDQFIYDNCDADGSLEHWRINGGGHDYYVQPLNDFTHSIEVWLFLRKWSHPNQLNQTTSLNEEVIDIKVYPNPASKEIELKINDIEKYTIKVYTKEGKLTTSVFSDNKLNISSLQNGMYFIRLESQEQVITKKFVVQH